MAITKEAELACVYLNTTQQQLECLNGVKARLYMPVTVFLGLLVVVGSLGNITVCLVYCRRKIRVSSHYFILSLAVLDLITCVIGMPTEMADLILPLTFDSPIACKVLRFLHSSTIIASSTILIEVAFDRYFRICQLGRQFTANKARLLCLGALLFGVIFSWPSCVIFGKKTVSIYIHGHVIKGTDCSTDDSMRGSIYPTIYYLFLFSLFGITLVFFSVLYSKIGLRIVTQNRMRAGGVAGSGPCGYSARRGDGGGGGGVGVNIGRDLGSPQEKLAQVLRSGMSREMEAPSSDLSSDPGSGASPSSPSSHRISGASGSSGTSATSGFSGSSGFSGTSGFSGSSSSSGYSGASCRSTTPLIHQSSSLTASSSSYIRESKIVVHVSGNLIGCSSSGVAKENTQTMIIASKTTTGTITNSNDNSSVDNIAPLVQKSSGYLDRIQVPTTIHETSRVKILASNLKPIQCYNYRNRSNEMIHSGASVSVLNETTESILSQDNNSDNRNNEFDSRQPDHSGSKANGGIIPKVNTTKGKKTKKSKGHAFSPRGLSCCCSCDRNEHQPNIKSRMEKNDEKNYEYSPNAVDFDDNTLPRKRKGKGHVPTTPTTHRTCNRQLRVGKTTTVLFAVTLAYILSFLPYLTVMVMRSIIKDLEESLSPMGELAYKLCVKSFFINNAINPIIYSFLNHSFRQDASRVLRRLCRRKSMNARANPAASI